MRVIADITDPAVIQKFSSIEEDRHAATVECSHNVALKSKSYCPEKKPWGECERLSKSLRK